MKTDRKPDPRKALDYPDLPDSLFVLWYSNGYKWPDARRSVGYLTAKKRGIMTGAALFSIFWNEAETFETEAAAREFLEENNRLRASQGGQPYHGIEVSTVAEMKRRCGYVES